MGIINEAFQKFELLEDIYDADEKGAEELGGLLDTKADDTQIIIDPLAETEEELQDSYVGKIILDCSVCQSKIYKDENEITIDEESGLANVGEECPYCYNPDGFKIIGKVAPYCQDGECEHNHEEDDTTIETEEENKIEEGCKKKSKGKALKETFDGEDVIADLVDRAKGWIDDGEDLEDAISQAIDDGLIYSRDIIDLAEHYGVLDDSELISKFYEDLYQDIYNEVSDYYDEEKEETYHITNVDWDVEDELEDGQTKEEFIEENDLPTEFDITVNYTRDDDLDEVISDAISDKYGWTINSYDYDLQEKLRESKKSVKESKFKINRKKKITEAKEVSETELAKFIKNSVEELKNGEQGTFYKKLGNDLYFVIGGLNAKNWDKEDLDDLATTPDKDFVICGKIAKNIDDLQADYDIDWYMISNEDGDIIDNEITFFAKDTDKDFNKYAKEVLDTFNKNFKNANIDDDGVIHYEQNEKLKESKKSKSCRKGKLTEAPIYDLTPTYDTRRSFYGKAKVDTGVDNKGNKLYSYNTLVAEIKNGKPKVYNTQSQTTLRHIKDWLLQNGFKAENKAQIIRDYGATKVENKLDNIDAEADNKKEVAKKKFQKSKDDVDSIKDMRIKRAKGKFQKAEDRADADRDMKKKRIKESTDEKVVFVEEDNPDLEYWYFDDEGLYGKDYTDGLIIDGGRQFRDMIYSRNNENAIKQALKEYEGRELLNQLKEITGKTYKNYNMRGYSQSDWATAYYPEGEFTKEHLDEINDAFMGMYTAFDNEDYGEVIVFRSDNRPVKKIISDTTGIPVEQIVIRRIKGYHQVPDYIDESIKLKESVTTKLVNTLAYVYGLTKSEARKQVMGLSKEEKESKLKELEGTIKTDAKTEFNESVENLEVEADDNSVEVKKDGQQVQVKTEDGKIKIEVGNDNKDEGGETIVPLDKEEETEITQQSNEDEEDNTDEEDIEITDFDEEEFDNLGESYLKEIYENVKSFKTTKGYINQNKLKLEGVITFKSGKEKKTTFVFESKTKTKTGKVKLVGCNEQFAKNKNAFTITGKVANKKLISESLTYNYQVKDKNNKAVRLYGTVSRKNK